MSLKGTHDVRVVLVREKYFSLRPKPLERWLWKQGVAPSTERVFWLHWELGHQAGTWCSEVPLRRVAAECCLDVSTVTRAYQQLTSLGLLRRQDPGRDPRNPFQQATAITEVRLPRDLICELDRYPNRRQAKGTPIQEAPTPPTEQVSPAPALAAGPRTPWREMLGKLKSLEEKMNARERASFNEAQRTHAGFMTFEADSGLTPEDRAAVLDWLSKMAARPTCAPTAAAATAERIDTPASSSRQPTVFEAARAKRDLERIAGVSATPELLRQIFWAIEKGPLKRFAPPHALNIAIKKVREGLWTRPHRMPPNWSIPLRNFAEPEQCRTA